MTFISEKAFNKIGSNLDLGLKVMLTNSNDAYDGQGPLMNGFEDKSVTPAKTNMQKHFENWLNRTKWHSDYPKR